MLPISVEQRKRQRSSSSILVNEQDDLDTEVEITPPPSPQPESNGDAGELKCAIWYFHTQEFFFRNFVLKNGVRKREETEGDVSRGGRDAESTKCCPN